MNHKKFFLSLIIVASFTIIASPAFAQETGQIPDSLRSMASELGCKSVKECETAFNANPAKGIELAEKYNVYDSKKQALATSYKKEILSRLASADQNALDEEIVKIAKEIITKNKTLAASFSLTNNSVKAAETIVNEVKNTGVDISTCSKPAASLTRDELVSCLEASKKLAVKAEEIKAYVPKEQIAKSETSSRALTLEEALAKGEYPELGTTGEEAASKCLRSGSESLSVCDEIAIKFFGKTGTQELAKARQETQSAKEFYSKSLESLSLKTPSGAIIIGKDAIKSQCDNAFSSRDIPLAKSCGEFAVKNGFVSQAEFEKGLALLKSFSSSTKISISECSINPENCAEFIPDIARGEFVAKQKIVEILKSKLGFDPSECALTSPNSDKEKKCISGSKEAIPELKILVSQYSGIQQIIDDIENKIAKSSEVQKKIENINTNLKTSQGPGGCASAGACYEYCRDPSHGAECIAFGAKSELFAGEDIVRKYQEFDRFLSVPANERIPISQPMFPNGESGLNPPTPPSYMGFREVSPECLSAIQSGNFEKAKSLCSGPSQNKIQERACQTVTPKPCGEGEYRQEKFIDSCPSYSECIPIPGYKKPDTQVQAQKQKAWYFKDGSVVASYILGREDGEYSSYIKSVEKECLANSTKATFRWKPNVGDSNSGNWKNFGIPDCSSSYEETQPQSCVPPLFWDDTIKKCIDGATDPLVIPKSCSFITTEFSCKAASGCNWISENGKKFCASNNYIPQTTGDYCGSYVSYNSCVSQKNCSWSNNRCYYSSQDYSSANWTNKLWTFKNGTDMSSVLSRVDKEYLDYIASVETQCKTINKENFCWKSGAGDQSNWQTFGIPDCSGSCSKPSTYSSSCPSFAHNMGGYCMLNNDTTRCAEYGSANSESNYSKITCETRSASMLTSSSSPTTYTGDANSCPGFAYSKWDNTGRRYCELNSARACDYNYPSYLTNGSSYKLENCPTNSVNTTSTSSTSSCSPSIYSGNTTAKNACDNTYCREGCTFNLNSCATSCINNNDQYGAQKLACDTAGNRWNLTTNTCEDRYAADKKSCTDAQGSWNYSQNYCQPYVSTSNNTSGTATQRCFYTNATKNSVYVGYTVWCERDYYNCHQGSQSGASIDLSGVSLGAPSSCEGGWSSGGGSGSNSGGSCTYGSIESCVANSACKWRYSSGSTTGGWCEPNSTSYGTTACNSNGSCEYGESSGSCPSDCSYSGGSSGSCPSGQYWNGTACANNNSTPDYSAQKLACETASGTWNTTSYYCQYPSSGGGSSSCPSGQYWNGSACVNSSSGGGSGSCPSGQYWNGSACTDSSAACTTAGGTWNSSTNYCQMPGSMSCPSGQYWNGTACASQSSQMETGKHFIATIYTASKNISGLFKHLLPFLR